MNFTIWPCEIVVVSGENMNPLVVTTASGVAGHVTIITVGAAASADFDGLPPQAASTTAHRANRVMRATVSLHLRRMCDGRPAATVAAALALVGDGLASPGVRHLLPLLVGAGRAARIADRVLDDLLAGLERRVVRDLVDAREVVRRHAVALRYLGELLLRLAHVLAAHAAGARLVESEMLLRAARDDDQLFVVEQRDVVLVGVEIVGDECLQHHLRVQLAAVVERVPDDEFGLLDAKRLRDARQRVAGEDEIEHALLDLERRD